MTESPDKTPKNPIDDWIPSKLVDCRCTPLPPPGPAEQSFLDDIDSKDAAAFARSMHEDAPGHYTTEYALMIYDKKHPPQPKPECTVCAGDGYVFGALCPKCGGLGRVARIT